MARSSDDAEPNPGAGLSAGEPLQSASGVASWALRPYEPRDEDASVALWLRTWRAAYPRLDFAKRLDWWRKRWREELLPVATVVVAEADGAMVGFVTVDRHTLYLDQIVVAPECWGSGVGNALINEAKRLSPTGLDLDVNTDNARALRFYARHEFAVSGAGTNPISGKPVHRMSWRPQVA
jgi:putative acetyltransferase